MHERTGSANETVNATETSFEVLECLRASSGVTLSEIADNLGLAKSTTYRHLVTLERLEYVVREGDEFHLALRFLNLGEAARSRSSHYEQVRESVEALAVETEERAQFIVEEHGMGVCVYRASGDRAVETSPTAGTRMPIHAIAAGKAILAFDETLDVDAYVADELEAPTERTITAPDTLREELESVRKNRYAVNEDEHIAGLTAFGVPIRRPSGGVVGALSISGPTNRLANPDHEAAVTSLLLGTANELELNIVHSDPTTRG